MFEHIHFMTYEGNYGAQEVQENKVYEQMMREHQMEANRDEEYHISGTSHYLLQHPMAADRRRHLIYLESFCYMQVGKEYYTRRRNLPVYLLLYTYHGKGKLHYGEKEYLLEENEGFIIDCRQGHSYETVGSKWEHSDFHFCGGISDYIYEENFASMEPFFHCSQPANYQKQLELILQIHNGASANREFDISREIEYLLAMVLDYQGMTHMQRKDVPKNIHFLQTYLEKHFAEDMSLDDMAKFSGISKYHLCRTFKECVGFSPGEYIIHLRLIQAMMLLQSTTIPSYRIGQLVGFKNEANFINHFKKENHMTPGDYRSRMHIEK